MRRTRDGDLEQWQLRAEFARRLSRMYAVEVPLYARLLVEVPQVVDTVGIGDERVGHLAKLQQALEVRGVARKPGGLQHQHQPRATDRAGP
jgi:uncharacterized glyoxalase superfamily metalloenzyme YdcJ